MAAYLILGLAVVAATVAALVARQVRPTRGRVISYATVVVVLFVLTALFDNLIVGFGIVGYDTSKILGLYVGRAPVEDFFYPLVAAYLVPVLWERR